MPSQGPSGRAQRLPRGAARRAVLSRLHRTAWWTRKNPGPGVGNPGFNTASGLWGP